MTLDRRRLFILGLAFVFSPACGALADRRRGRARSRGRGDEDDDHEQAWRALRSGDIRPLREILDQIRDNHEGEVVGIEFEHDDGIPVYEIKMITPEGRFIEIEVDARTGELIELERDEDD